MQQNDLEKENKMVEEVMNLMAFDNEDSNGNIVSIGFDETLYAMRLNVVKYVLLASTSAAAGGYVFAVKCMQKKEEEVVMKGVEFAKNEMEMKDMSRDMLRDDNAKGNGNWIEMERFNTFWQRKCDEKNIELRMVGVHSAITKQFAKGLSGCAAVLHYPIHLRGDYDDEEQYLSD